MYNHEGKKIAMWAMTYKCNLSCKNCYLKDSWSKKMKNNSDMTDEECIDMAHKIADSTDWKPDAVWLTGGETTIRRNLNEVIKILEKSNISTVINTNGILSEELAIKIANASPRGINISLDMLDAEDNDELRGKTDQVYNTIKILSERKNSYTILGVAIVLNNYNAANLYDIALELKKRGVEYISLNPYHSQDDVVDDFFKVDIEKLKENIRKIEMETDIKLPSNTYLELIYSYYRNEQIKEISCPAANDFCFIAPWGEVFPCSNELWHNIEIKDKVYIDESLGKCMDDLKESFGFKEITTKSKCFSTRCIGLWKLFYDDVFTCIECYN